jgi:hypothetical protein
MEINDCAYWMLAMNQKIEQLNDKESLSVQVFGGLR